MNKLKRLWKRKWRCHVTEACLWRDSVTAWWHANCAHFTGKLRGHLRAAAAEGEAQVQQFWLVPEEHLPWPPCSWGQGGLARGCECLPSISLYEYNSCFSVLFSLITNLVLVVVPGFWISQKVMLFLSLLIPSVKSPKTGARWGRDMGKSCWWREGWTQHKQMLWNPFGLSSKPL